MNSTDKKETGKTDAEKKSERRNKSPLFKEPDYDTYQK